MIQTSHVGSLPFVDVNDANKFNRQFDLPVLYSLPILDKSEFMLAQVVGEIDLQNFSRQLLDEVIEINHIESIFAYKQFKFQMIGPVTLIKSFKNISDDEICLLLTWYENQLLAILGKDLMDRCYFFLDEPMLFMATEKDYGILNQFLKRFQKKFHKIGIHCCSNFDIKKIDISLIQGLSFESQYYKPNLYGDIDLFLGVLDTSTFDLDPPLDLCSISNEIYVTPHCGLALSEVKTIQLVSKKLTEWIKMASL